MQINLFGTSAIKKSIYKLLPQQNMKPSLLDCHRYKINTSLGSFSADSNLRFSLKQRYTSNLFQFLLALSIQPLLLRSVFVLSYQPIRVLSLFMSGVITTHSSFSASIRKQLSDFTWIELSWYWFEESKNVFKPWPLNFCCNALLYQMFTN